MQTVPTVPPFSQLGCDDGKRIQSAPAHQNIHPQHSNPSVQVKIKIKVYLLANSDDELTT